MVRLFLLVLSVSLNANLALACENDQECKGARVCIDGACSAPAANRCKADIDCSGDLICVKRQCIADGTHAKVACSDTSGCSTDETCQQGVCIANAPMAQPKATSVQTISTGAAEPTLKKLAMPGRELRPALNIISLGYEASDFDLALASSVFNTCFAFGKPLVPNTPLYKCFGVNAFNMIARKSEFGGRGVSVPLGRCLLRRKLV